MAKGWLDNYNDSKVSLPEGYVGEGYSTKGRNYSPAWGGQFQMGGKLKSSIPVIEDAGNYNEEGRWVPDWKTMTAQAKKLGAKKVKTKHGSLIVFDDNWEVVGVDDNPDAMQTGGLLKNLPKVESFYKQPTKSKKEIRNVEKDKTATKPVINERLTTKELDEINSNLQKIEDAKAYYRDYLNSPKAKERIANMMDDSSGSKYAYLYDDEVNPVDEEIKNRLEGLNKLKGKFDYVNDVGNDLSSYYDPRLNWLHIRPNSDMNISISNGDEYIGNTDDDIRNTIGHEIGHNIARHSNQNSNNVWYSNGISKKESDLLMNANMGLLGSKNRDEVLKSKANPEIEYELDHDNKPSELKADIDALRYQLYRQGIYNPGTQDFTREHLEKAKPSFTKNRLKEHFIDEDIIDLMNKLSYNKTNNDGVTPIAQMGGSIPGAVGFSYARTNDPAPSNGPYAKKTKASAQEGINIVPIKGRSHYSPLSNSIYLDETNGPGVKGHELYHYQQHQEGRDFIPEKWNWGPYLPPSQPQTPYTEEAASLGYNRRRLEAEGILQDMYKYMPDLQFMPKEVVEEGFNLSSGIHMQGIEDNMYDNPYTLEGEARLTETPEGRQQLEERGIGVRQFQNGGWLNEYDVAQNGKKKFKLKDERLETIRPSESTFVKKPNFESEQAKVQRTYVDQIGKQMTEEKRRKKLTKDQREREDYNARNKERGSIQAYVPESTWDRTKAIVSNPMTAIGYKVRGENLPGRFQYGPRNEHDYAVDWINPLQGAVALSEIPGELSRGEFMNAGLSGLDALDLGTYVRGAKKVINPLIKKGAKQLGNIPTNVSPGLKGAIPATKNIKKTLSTKINNLQQTNTYKAIDEHVSGINKGLLDKRPFFEKFPITKSQKAKVYAAQDQALKEGNQFIKDWHYGDGVDLHPDIVDKMKELDPDFKLSTFGNTNITNTVGSYANPFAITNNALVSTRRNILNNENISDEAKQFMLNNRNKIEGVNLKDTKESLTLRNKGLYHYSPSEIKDTVIHEAGHTSEHLGTLGHRNPDGTIDFGSIPFDNIRTYDPNFTGYYMANPNTEQGKLFQEAMVEPTPHIKDADGNITKKGYTWEASPGELHSELLPARSSLIDAYVAQGYDRKEIMNMIRADASNDQIDWMIQNKNLNRFFKPTTSPELKRKVIRMLYAGVPAAVGLNAITAPEDSSIKMRKGGVIKDDLGQWAHPGEITEINSNDITMEGVPYDVLGISDEGDTKLMKPGKKYKFKGKKVTEFPMAKNGLRQEQKGLVNLDNLTNFTNYNTKQPGGWLDQY